jgi:hypothetical protein
MPSPTSHMIGRVGSAAAALTIMVSASPATSQGQRGSMEPFREFVGSWSGSGRISLAHGSSERIRCQVVHMTGSDAGNLRSRVRCASDNYRFELNSDVNYQVGALLGAWREVSRNVSGGLSGTASPGQITARINASGFSATLALAVRGRQQSITFNSQGAEFTGMEINLTRR